MRLTSARTSWGEVVVQGNSVDPGRSKVRAAWLSSPADVRRCAGGVPGTLTWQEGGESVGARWSAAAPTDGHRFEVGFMAGDTDALGHDSVIDVQLDAPAAACLRVPFAGVPPAPGWSWNGRWYAGAALRFAPVAPTIDGAHEVVSISLRAGRWTGPVRVTGELGAGLHGCSADCDGHSFQWLEAALGLEGFVARGDAWVVSLEGAYTALPGSRRACGCAHTGWSFMPPSGSTRGIAPPGWCSASASSETRGSEPRGPHWQTTRRNP